MSVRLTLSAVTALLSLWGLLAPSLGSTQETASYDCTLVIGYSQVRQWFTTGGVFESIVEGDRWELKAPGGAGVDTWADPADERWQAEIASPCAMRPSDEPDRIVFGISGPFGEDEETWADTIREALGLIRTRFPSAISFVLVPVAGGPDHGDCMFDGRLVRASWQHKHIDNAIQMVVQSDAGGSVHAGPSPHVRDCSDYRDARGHLTDDAAERIGEEIAQYFRETSDH